MTIPAHEAKERFQECLLRVGAGEVITILENDIPIAELRPAAFLKRQKLQIGVLKGEFEVPDDFDAPLPEFESLFYDTARKSEQK